MGKPEISTRSITKVRHETLNCKLIDCTVKRWGIFLSVVEEELILGGMSGSAILMDGKAIGAISTNKKSNPVIRDCLPAWFFRRHALCSITVVQT
jgi:hypothetical protein